MKKNTNNLSKIRYESKVVKITHKQLLIKRNHLTIDALYFSTSYRDKVTQSRRASNQRDTQGSSFKKMCQIKSKHIKVKV